MSSEKWWRRSDSRSCQAKIVPRDSFVDTTLLSHFQTATRANIDSTTLQRQQRIRTEDAQHGIQSANEHGGRAIGIESAEKGQRA